MAAGAWGATRGLIPQRLDKDIRRSEPILNARFRAAPTAQVLGELVRPGPEAPSVLHGASIGIMGGRRRQL